MSEHKEQSENTKLDEIARHSHLCLIYESEAELLVPVVPFIQKGIAQGERCIYLNAGEGMLDCVLKNALSQQKNDIGAIVVLSAQQVWFKDGAFSVDRVLEQLQVLCSRAVEDGFKGSRIICDMGWARGTTGLASVLANFEVELTRFADRNEVSLLCLYQRGSFASGPLLEVARLHQLLLVGGAPCPNPFYLPPDRAAEVPAVTSELDLFLTAAQAVSGAASDRERLRQELEQAYAALARKIYENWQEEDTLKASEKELQEKDEALLEHRRRLQTVLQHLPILLMAFDAGNALTSCNHEFERITGYKAEEVMGTPLLELLDLEDAEREEVLQEHPPEGGDYQEREWRLRCKDGSSKWVCWFNMSWYTGIPGWVNWIIGLDVTPRRQAELGARLLKDELLTRTGDLEALGQAIARDLGAQLAKIGSDCALLEELHGKVLPAPCRDIVREIHESAVDMAGRVAALRRFTALPAGDLSSEQVDLSAIAEEVAARLGGRGGERRVTFKIEEGVTATGDRKLLRIALEQLLESAWHSTCGVAHPMIRFGTAQVGERSFFVSNNGLGNQEDRLPSHPEQSTGPASVLEGGIALATVQRIISLHRGRIWAADEAGRGATVYFRV
jgi:PAS domain S-box-containing protein